MTGSAKLAGAILKAGFDVLGQNNEVLQQLSADLEEFEAAISQGNW